MRFAISCLAAAPLALALGACTETLVVDATGADVPNDEIYASTVGAPDGVVSAGEELQGRVLRVQTTTTDNLFVFLDSNVFRIEDDSGTRVVQGTYQMRGENVCVAWQPRGVECWPAAPLLTATTPQTITSDRGQSIRVSLIDN